MPAFEYLALDPAGKRKRGLISADSGAAARRALRQRDLAPLEVVQADARQRAERPSLLRRTTRSRLSKRERLLVTRQLATLIEAGLPVAEALGAVAGQAGSPAARRLVLGLRARVNEGERLSAALAGFEDSFSPVFIATIAAGEASGALGQVLDRLATHLEASEALSRRLTAALVYPIVLAITALTVCGVLMVAIVPRLAEQFTSMGVGLPVLTQGVIAVSETLQAGWPYILAGIAALILGLRYLIAQPAVKVRLDRLWLRAPGIGAMIREVEAARFARTAAIILGAGGVLPDALRAARDATSNSAVRDAVRSVIEAVETGRNLTDALSAANIMPPLALSMIAAGERSGALEPMMLRAAARLEADIDAAASVALSLLEPGIIIVMGGLVALIVLSVLLPILQLNTLALG